MFISFNLSITGKHILFSYDHILHIMVTKNFTVKVTRIRNKKDSDYFVYRANIPKSVGDELQLNEGDRVFFRAKKAEWYHTLDWSQMEQTWNKMPIDIQKQIQLDGLLEGTKLQPKPSSELTKRLHTGTGSTLEKTEEESHNILGSG